MTDRYIIGHHSNFNSRGLFLSRPGDSVLSPGRSLLIDSRFQNLSVHAEGRIRMSRYSGDGDTSTVWWATATFPSLGYEPLFYGSITYVNQNWLNIPANSNFYPTSDCASPVISYTTQYGIWLEDETTLRAKNYLGVGGAGSCDFYYVIFKRGM